MAASPAERLFTRGFVLAAAANFLHSLALHTYLHFPGFLDGLGADELLIGSIVAVMSVTAIASRPLIGRLMDRRGRKVAIVLGGSLNLLAGLAYMTVESIGPWLLFVRVLHGLGHALIFSSLFTYAADIIPASRRAEGIALFGISGMLPVAIGGVFGDLILAGGDYRSLFLGIAAAALAGLLISLPLPESRQPKIGVRGRGTWAAIKMPGLSPLWFMTLAVGIGMASYMVFLKTFVLETGEGSVGGFFTVYAVSAITLRVVGARLPERVGMRRVLIPSVVGLAIGLGVLGLVPGAVGVYAAGVLCGAGHGYAFPILNALIVERADERDRGLAISMYTALFDLGVLVGGPALGAVVQFRDYPSMFLGTGVFLALSSLVFWRWDERILSMNPRIGAPAEARTP